MATSNSANPSMLVLKETMASIVRSDLRDLSARRLAIFLKIYLDPKMNHTVRGLADDLKVSRPAISQALDLLEGLRFARRETDETDRRSVVVRRTRAGSAYLRTLGGYLTAASKAAANAS